MKNYDETTNNLLERRDKYNETQRINFTEEVNDLLNIELNINLFTVDEDVFNYDDSDKYTSLTPVEIMQLQSILCIKE